MTEVVTDNSSEHQYELRSDGTLAAVLLYRRHDHTMTIVHTEVEPEFEGRGFGSEIAKAALDDARAHGSRVLVACPFVKGYIQRHPEYADLTSARGGAP